MPKYTDKRLLEWKEKGYMSFTTYADFQKKYNALVSQPDRNLLTVLYFTGARPAEIIELTRGDIFYRNQALTFKMTTLKRRTDRHTRLIDINTGPYIELMTFWDSIRSLPNDYYVFGFLRPPNHTNPRQYIKKKLGVCGYFYRHNIFSLMKQGGATNEQILLMKGGKSLLSVLPYQHLGKKEREGIKSIIDKSLIGEQIEEPKEKQAQDKAL